MSEPTVRERIKKIQTELRDGAPTPQLARTAVMALTALAGNVADEERGREAAYKAVLFKALESHAKANRARIAAENTEEYAKYREAHDTAKLVKELVISCRGYLRSLSDEIRST